MISGWPIACAVQHRSHSDTRGLAEESNAEGLTGMTVPGACPCLCRTAEVCNRVDVTIGTSSSRQKTVTPGDNIVWCPSTCGPDCRTNTDYATAGDTFDVQVLDDGRVKVKRTDSTRSWAMNLKVPCCKGMWYCRQGCIERGGGLPLPPLQHAQSMPSPVPLTTSASFNGICNRQ